MVLTATNSNIPAGCMAITAEKVFGAAIITCRSQIKYNNQAFNGSNVKCPVVRYQNHRFTVNQTPMHGEITTTVVKIHSVQRTPTDKFTNRRYVFTSKTLMEKIYTFVSMKQIKTNNTKKIVTRTLIGTGINT